MFKNKNLQILSHNWPHDMDVSDVTTEMYHSRHESNPCHSETNGKNSERKWPYIMCIQFLFSTEIKPLWQQTKPFGNARKLWKKKNERGQLSGKYSWWQDSNGFRRQIWYDMIWYTCWLQFGWHPVAIVHYTFPHKTIHRTKLWSRIHKKECT